MSRPPPIDDRLLRGELDDAQRERLVRAVADSPQARAEWAQCLLEDVLLRQLAQPPQSTFARRRRWMPVALVATAALLLLGVGLAIALGDGDAPTTPPDPATRVHNIGPDRYAGTADGAACHYLGAQLPEPDAAGTWQLQHAGDLQLAVAERSTATPVRVQTPRATFEVVGTRFDVHHGDHWTRLAVHDGRVRAHVDGTHDTPIDAGRWWRIDATGAIDAGTLLDDDPAALFDLRQSPVAHYPNRGDLAAAADLLPRLHDPMRTAGGLVLSEDGYLHTREPLRFACTGRGPGIKTITAWMHVHDLAAAPDTALRLYSLAEDLPRQEDIPKVWTISPAAFATAGIGPGDVVHIALVPHQGRLVILLDGKVVAYLPPDLLPPADGTPRYLIIAPTHLPPGVQAPRWLRCAFYERVFTDADIAAQIAAGPDGLVSWIE